MHLFPTITEKIQKSFDHDCNVYTNKATSQPTSQSLFQIRSYVAFAISTVARTPRVFLLHALIVQRCRCTRTFLSTCFPSSAIISNQRWHLTVKTSPSPKRTERERGPCSKLLEVDCALKCRPNKSPTQRQQHPL